MASLDSATQVPTNRLDSQEALFKALLHSYGIDWKEGGLRDTPLRAALAWHELLSGYDAEVDMTYFEQTDATDMVALTDIPYFSLCEHHLMPFYGSASVVYIPNGDIIVGVSKLARVVQKYSRRLQVQERMTHEIAEFLDGELEPVGIGVYVKGQHMCMMARGIQKPGAMMKTSAVRGAMKDNPEARAEYLNLVMGG